MLVKGKNDKYMEFNEEEFNEGVPRRSDWYNRLFNIWRFFGIKKFLIVETSKIL